MRIETSTQVGRVFIDASQLERRLLNLSLNARDAMPEGGKLITTIAESRVPNEDGETATMY